jgi:hypothetical protein
VLISIELVNITHIAFRYIKIILKDVLVVRMLKYSYIQKSETLENGAKNRRCMHVCRVCVAEQPEA